MERVLGRHEGPASYLTSEHAAILSRLLRESDSDGRERAAVLYTEEDSTSPEWSLAGPTIGGEQGVIGPDPPDTPLQIRLHTHPTEGVGFSEADWSNFISTTLNGTPFGHLFHAPRIYAVVGRRFGEIEASGAVKAVRPTLEYATLDPVERDRLKRRAHQNNEVGVMGQPFIMEVLEGYVEAETTSFSIR